MEDRSYAELSERGKALITLEERQGNIWTREASEEIESLMEEIEDSCFWEDWKKGSEPSVHLSDRSRDLIEELALPGERPRDVIERALEVYRDKERRTRKMTFEEACSEWQEWATANAPYNAVGDPPQPNWQLSELRGTTWHLRNVHGDLCKVMWNGQVVVAHEGR